LLFHKYPPELTSIKNIVAKKPKVSVVGYGTVETPVFQLCEKMLEYEEVNRIDFATLEKLMKSLSILSVN